MEHSFIPSDEYVQHARDLHKNNIVFDSLAPGFIDEWLVTPSMREVGLEVQAKGGTRPAIKEAMARRLIEQCTQDNETRREYLDYWDRAGVTAGNYTLYASGPPDTAYEATLRAAQQAQQFAQLFNGELSVANTANEVEAAYKARHHVVMFNLQSAEPVGSDLDRVDKLHELGVRSMQLTYNLRTRFGDGCLETNDGGLSRFGEALIEKMNSTGIIVDLSHASAGTAKDAVAASRRPVIASHTAARNISGHRRGLWDEVLKGISDTGGYAGVVILPAFIVGANGNDNAERAGKPRSWATLDVVVDHILHLVNVMGTDHVGVGTDWGKPYYNALTWTPEMVKPQRGFNWIGWRPEDRFDPNAQTYGMETWDQWPNLTAALLQRGMPEDVVVKIIGGNYMRVLREFSQ
ncbi:dipeptidase [Ottowia thiooxydans]|uniref:dipeptidase n=1 Tax=Ottowia thiooxydans TaxID=219182 RepID=UPI0004194834|nr:membrane dipeptidase [Ottowia thiooxydans]